MKKFKYVFLTSALAVALVGCGNGTTDNAADDSGQLPDPAVEEQVENPQVEDPTSGGMEETDTSIDQPVDNTQGNLPTTGEELTLEEAKTIALEKAMVTEAEITDFEGELDSENGMSKYDISFKVGEKEYDYDIDALTGEIISEEIE